MSGRPGTGSYDLVDNRCLGTEACEFVLNFRPRIGSAMSGTTCCPSALSRHISLLLVDMLGGLNLLAARAAATVQHNRWLRSSPMLITLLGDVSLRQHTSRRPWLLVVVLVELLAVVFLQHRAGRTRMHTSFFHQCVVHMRICCYESWRCIACHCPRSRTAAESGARILPAARASSGVFDQSHGWRAPWYLAT